jgi:hypothetical protein
LINAGLLYVVNIWPGWEAVPFLTAESVVVMGLVNASVASNVVANAVYLLHDPPRWKALGSMATTIVGILALMRIWQVFPFDFGSSTFSWPLVIRTVLAVSIIGSAIGIIVAFVAFAQSFTAHSH